MLLFFVGLLSGRLAQVDDPWNLQYSLYPNTESEKLFSSGNFWEHSSRWRKVTSLTSCSGPSRSHIGEHTLQVCGAQDGTWHFFRAHSNTVISLCPFSVIAAWLFPFLSSPEACDAWRQAVLPWSLLGPQSLALEQWMHSLLKNCTFLAVSELPGCYPACENHPNSVTRPREHRLFLPHTGL